LGRLRTWGAVGPLLGGLLLSSLLCASLLGLLLYRLLLGCLLLLSSLLCASLLRLLLGRLLLRRLLLRCLLLLRRRRSVGANRLRLIGWRIRHWCVGRLVRWRIRDRRIGRPIRRGCRRRLIGCLPGIANGWRGDRTACIHRRRFTWRRLLDQRLCCRNVRWTEHLYFVRSQWLARMLC